MWVLAIIIIIVLFVFFAQSETNKITAPKKENSLLRDFELKHLSNFKNDYKFNVAGVHEYKYEILNFCKTNDIVYLIPEPDNKFDSDAIKIMCNELLIGYVPSYDTDEVSKLLNRNYFAYIENLEKDPGWINVKIKIAY